MKLSIIIPYYNVKKYTDELLSVLDPQITDEVEVTLVDDGSPEPFLSDYSWLTVIWLKHGGPSKARNAGLNVAIGDYVAFIDADDIVAKDYIKNILECAERNPDYIELSWKSLTPEGTQFNCHVTSTYPLKNPSVCTRVFKRNFIGDLRFNEQKDVAEDEEFTRKLNLSRGSRGFIGSYMYFYRTSVQDSQTKLYKRGLKNTKKIIYHIPEVTDRSLVEEIRELDKKDEVFLFCNDNHIPELAKYCQISKPHRTWAHELRGEPCSLVEIIPLPINTQVVIYINGSQGHDGITTFIYNFCSIMKKYYDILVLHDYLSTSVINRLRPHVRVERRGTVINCDTLLIMRIADNVPPEVNYKKLYQVVHCTHSTERTLNRDPADCVFVSETSRKSFTDKEVGHVIYNIGNPERLQKALILMSTTRVGANDKGDQDKFMLQFADHLNRHGVNFLWFYFSVNTLHGAPSNVIRLDPVDDVRGYLAHADYLVHLSENEAYCYSITEALSVGVPVIAFDLPVLHELGFRDEIDGYIIPKDMSIDVNIILNTPGFKGFDITDNIQITEQWRGLLGDTIPLHDYVPESMVTVKAIKPYSDMQLNRTIKPDERLTMWRDRADHLKQLGLVEIIGG